MIVGQFSTMTEADITKLLAERHSKDVFIPQCKNGPTQGVHAGELLVFDAWAMTRSWTNPRTIIYEIKVSRSDFLRDTKWQRALDYCHEFYWAAPSGMIDKTEIHPHCGLVEVTKTGTSLRTRKKAVWRNAEPPVDLMTYVIMCRAHDFRGDVSSTPNAAYWRKWLKDREENNNLGYAVSRRIQEIVRTRIETAERENRALQKDLEVFEEITDRLVEIGLATRQGGRVVPEQWGWRRRLDELAGIVPKRLIAELRGVANELEAFGRQEG